MTLNVFLETDSKRFFSRNFLGVRIPWWCDDRIADPCVTGNWDPGVTGSWDPSVTGSWDPGVTGSWDPTYAVEGPGWGSSGITGSGCTTGLGCTTTGSGSSRSTRAGSKSVYGS